MTALEFQVLDSIHDIDAAHWDHIGRGNPFTSHRWHRFGEVALTSDRPCYVVIHQQSEAVAYGVFWLARHEPLPITSPVVRPILATIFRRWPLLICRAPLAHVPGIALPDSPLRPSAQEYVARALYDMGQKNRASFMFFDYLSGAQDWPNDFSLYTVEGADTRMEIEWPDFESYLSSLSKSARKDYHRHTNRAADLGIEIRCNSTVSRVDDALTLIRRVEQHHHTPPNPHARSILENAHQVDSTWITAEIDGRLVGCGLLIGDQGVQMLTLLGLDYTIQFAYFQLVYAAIRHAIETGVRELRGGTGAYELKQRLGFQLVTNNTIAYTTHHRALRWLARRFS